MLNTLRHASIGAVRNGIRIPRNLLEAQVSVAGQPIQSLYSIRYSSSAVNMSKALLIVADGTEEMEAVSANQIRKRILFSRSEH